MTANMTTANMMTISRDFSFCAGHRLFRPEWSEQRNNDVFGLCANPAGHGHNYRLEVTVSGPIDAETGMIMNLRTLKEVVREKIIAEVDHKNLNVDVPWMKDVIPTTERFAEQIWARLTQVLAEDAPTARLAALVLHETDNNRVRLTADR